MKAISAISGFFGLLFFALFNIACVGLPKSNIQYPLIVDVCGYGFFSLLWICAVSAIFAWLEDIREKR
jgi:hypothetical protein